MPSELQQRITPPTAWKYKGKKNRSYENGKRSKIIGGRGGGWRRRAIGRMGKMKKKRTRKWRMQLFNSFLPLTLSINNNVPNDSMCLVKGILK